MKQKQMPQIFNENRMKIAQDHDKYMSLKYSNEIDESISKSSVFRNSVVPVDKNSYVIPNIIVENLDCSNAVKKYNGNNTCLLNFASYKYPGGGFIKGAMAQEEAICHDSNLYNIIGSQEFAGEYEYNRNHLHNGLYSNFAIYSPGVIFELDKNQYKVNVLSCPAPNVNAYSKYNQNPNMSLVNSIMQDRIEFLLNVCKITNSKTLILGAFGCGVFKNDPVSVANIFKTILYSGKYDFNTVVFAIPGGVNYDTFNNVFNN